MYKSISKTRSFTPSSTNKEYVFMELSRSIERACMKASLFGLGTTQVNFFIKTQDFNCYGMEVKLSNSLSTSKEIIKVIKESFDKIYQHGVLYRATGVTLEKLASYTPPQADNYKLYPSRFMDLFKGEVSRKRLGIPVLGDAY